MAGAGRIKGITIEIEGNTTKLVSSLKDVDKQIKNTQTALKDVDKLLKLDPGNTELLQQKQKLLGDAVAQTSDRLNQLKNAQSQVAKGSEDWDALQREIIETEQNLDKLKNDVSDFGSVAAQKVKVVGEKFQEVGGKIESAGRAISKISGVAAGALGGIAKMGYDAVTAADDLNTLSKQTGVSTDELQKWNYAADLVDVSTDTITGAMRKMKKGVDSNSKAFEALGVQTKYNSGRLRSSTDIFYDTIEALSKIQDETERDIAAMEIFGKSADDLAGVIDDGGAALKAYGEEAEQMGLVIGGDTLDKLNEANDTIDRMKATMGASLAQAGATIAQTFAPALEKVVGVIEQIAEKVRTLSPEQTEMITKILAIIAVIGPLLVAVGKVVSFIGTIMTFLPAIGSAIGALLSPIGLVVAAIAAVVAAFAYFYNTNEEFRNSVNALVEQVKNIIGGLIEQITAWFKEHETEIKAIIEVVKTIILTGLQNIVTAISTALDVLGSIFKAFEAIMQGDWRTALEYLKSAARSAVNGVTQIFKNLGSMLNSIFKDIISKFKQWGKDMIDNLVNGIKDKIDTVKDAIKNVADVIKSYIHFSVPDVGPLADADTYAPDMMKLFAQGINDNAHLITDAIGTSFDLRPYFTTMNNGLNRLANAATNSANTSGQQGPVVVNVALEGDANRLFRVLSEEAHKDWQMTGQSKLMGY